MTWNIRLFGERRQLYCWAAKNEPNVVWREDGRAIVQWKNEAGLVTVIVSPSHSISYGPKVTPPQEEEK